MSKKNKRSDRSDIVYSTNKDFDFESEEMIEETLDPSEQSLKVLIDRKQRKGKSVTLVKGFIGSDDDLKELGKLLKTKCGVGGSVKNGEIVIQGELKQKVMNLLINEGYPTKLVDD